MNYKVQDKLCDSQIVVHNAWRSVAMEKGVRTETIETAGGKACSTRLITRCMVASRRAPTVLLRRPIPPTPTPTQFRNRKGKEPAAREICSKEQCTSHESKVTYDWAWMNTADHTDPV